MPPSDRAILMPGKSLITRDHSRSAAADTMFIGCRVIMTSGGESTAGIDNRPEMDGPVGLNQAAVEPGQDFVYEFVVERKASGAATSSVARQLAAIRMAHRHLAVERHRPDDPTIDLEGVRVPSGIPKPLTEAQVTSLLAEAAGSATRSGDSGRRREPRRRRTAS